jgi:hypothetical protein
LSDFTGLAAHIQLVTSSKLEFLNALNARGALATDASLLRPANVPGVSQLLAERTGR